MKLFLKRIHFGETFTVGQLYEDSGFSLAPICYTLEDKFIRTWSSITEAADSLNIKRGNISNCLIGKSKYCGDFQWKYYSEDTSNIEPVSKKEKSVYQFDLQGNLLKCWKSLSEASKQFDNQSAAKSAIYNVCHNITHQAYGYYWSFTSKFEYVQYGTAVACYDDDGNFIKSFTRIVDAAKEYNALDSNMVAVIKGKHKHCKGLRWRYFYGNTSKIKPLN